jgi:hypothetical protein
MRRPASWRLSRDRTALYPDGPGELAASFFVPARRRYTVWLGSTVRGKLEMWIDGRELGELERQFGTGNEYQEVGTIELDRGAHRMTASYSVPALAPGTINTEGLLYPLGGLVLSSAPDAPAVQYFAPARAGRLCGQAWDWLEAVRR